MLLNRLSGAAQPWRAGSGTRDSDGRAGSWRFFLTTGLDRKLERKRVAS